MGVSISWTAVHSDDSDRIHELIQANPTGETDEYFESQLAAAPLRAGWYLIVGQGCENSIVSSETLKALSDLGPVVGCSIEEHVMFSSAECWNSNSRIWSLVHNSEEGIYHLDESGTLPETFEAIKSQAISEQDREGGADADVDVIFDVPLSMAKSLVGFKHDEVPDCLLGPLPVALTSTRSVSRKWWKFW